MAMLHRKIWDFGKYIREKQGEAVQSALEKKDELGLRTTRYITKLQVATYGSLGAYFLYETYESWTAFTESQDIVPLVLNATSLGGHIGGVAITSMFVYDHIRHTQNLTNAINELHKN